MKNKEQFDWAIAVLVQAYMHDTLKKKKCNACAVGNLIAARNHYKQAGHHWISEDATGYICIHPEWTSSVRSYTGAYGVNKESDHFRQVESQIASIGYTVAEVARIEAAFEGWLIDTKIPGYIETIKGTCNEDIFDALMRVVDVLCEIHETDQSTRQETRQLFTISQ